MTGAACRYLMVLILCAVARPPSSARAANPADPDVPTPYMVILTGGELLSGIYADSHLQYITRTLEPLGCQCAGALVTEGKAFPDGSLIIGSPAKVARALTPEEIAGLTASAENYRQRALAYATDLKPWTP